MSILPIITGLLGMGIVFLLVPPIQRRCRRANLFLRPPDLHHTHKAPVPRVGGIALAAAFVGIEIFIAACFPARGEAGQHAVILAGSLAMFALGLWDDLTPLGARRKLLGQILISVVVCYFGIGIENFKIPFTGTIINLGAWGVLITVLWLVSMTNLINLIDGVDGLAGGICLMLMALLAWVGHQNLHLGLVASGMAGALLGFLWFNFPPARIYLGDGGAYFLGFQIGLFTIVSSQKGTILAALVAPLFVLALPIVDTALAILRRGLQGLPIFRPDRRHIHHRLIDMGLSRRQVVLSLYALTLVFLLMGFAAFLSRGQLAPTLLGIVVLVILFCAGRLSFSREWFAVGRVLGNSVSMRQEIQYALCLTRWLTLEGNRRGSIEGLWSDLLFLAQRLGFTSVKLTLADGERLWERPANFGTSHSARHVLQGGRYGVLELKAPSSPEGAGFPAASQSFDEQSEMSFRPGVSDGRLFEILSELLAEGWIKAASRWENGSKTPLRFDSRASAHRNGAQGKSLAGPPLPQHVYGPAQPEPN